MTKKELAALVDAAIDVASSGQEIPNQVYAPIAAVLVQEALQNPDIRRALLESA